MSRLLITILTACSFFGCSNKAANHNESSAAIPVTATKAEQRAVTTSLRAVGNVEAINSVAIVSRVDGQISKVLVQDGQEVLDNQILFQIDAVPMQIQLRGAEAALARDQAKLENAKVRADHGRAVLAEHFISPDDYTQLKTDFDSAQATVDADRAARDNAALQLDYATIRAPVAGKLGHIALQVGSMVHAISPTPLTTLNVLDPIDVTFALPEQNIGSLRSALVSHAVVNVGVSDDNDKQAELSGKLIFIDNAADSATGTIRLRARFENGARTLWPGQFVATVLPLASDPNAIVVPSAAIQHGPSGTYVFVVTNESTAEQRSVEVLRTTDSDATVVGVAPGEEVVVDGQSRLAPGSRVALHDQRLAGAPN